MSTHNKWVFLKDVVDRDNTQLLSLKDSFITTESEKTLFHEDAIFVTMISKDDANNPQDHRHEVHINTKNFVDLYHIKGGLGDFVIRDLKLRQNGKDVDYHSSNEAGEVLFKLSDKYSGEVLDVTYLDTVYGQIVLSSIDKLTTETLPVDHEIDSVIIDFKDSKKGDRLQYDYRTQTGIQNKASGKILGQSVDSPMYLASLIDGSASVLSGVFTGNVEDPRSENGYVNLFKPLKDMPVGAQTLLPRMGDVIYPESINTIARPEVDSLLVRRYDRLLTSEERDLNERIAKIEALCWNYNYDTIVESASIIEKSSTTPLIEEIYVRLSAGDSTHYGSILRPYIKGHVRLVDSETHKEIPVRDIKQIDVDKGVYRFTVESTSNTSGRAIVAVGGVAYPNLAIELQTKDTVPVNPDDKFRIVRFDADVVNKLNSGLNQYKIQIKLDKYNETTGTYLPYTDEEIVLVNEIGDPLKGNVVLAGVEKDVMIFNFLPKVAGVTGVRIKVEGEVLDRGITINLGQLDDTGALTEFEYALDELGTNPANYIKGELHTVSSLAFRDYFLLIPKAAPFFEADFRVRYKSPDYPEWKLLEEGVHYSFVLDHVEATSALRKAMYGGIVIHDLDLSGIIEIDYRTLGGIHVVDSHGIKIKIIEEAFNPSTINWSWVTDVPPFLPPEDHEHELEDITGIDDLIAAINKVAEATADSSKESSQASKDFLEGFNIKLFNRIMADMLDHPYAAVSAQLTELKRRLYNIEQGVIVKQEALGTLDKMVFGVIYPTVLKEAPAGTFFLNGGEFDTQQWARLGQLFPTGILPDLTGRTFIGSGGEFSLGTLIEQRLLKHSHEHTLKEAGEHNHNGTIADSGSHGHTATSASAGSHQHTLNMENAGSHTHDRGDMNIKGEFQLASDSNNSVAIGPFFTDVRAGAFSGRGVPYAFTHDYTYKTSDGTWVDNVEELTLAGIPVFESIIGVSFNPTDQIPTGYLYSQNAIPSNVEKRFRTTVFNAEDAWTGNTSPNGSHKHNITIDNIGDHTHTITVNAAGTHSHELTISNAGRHGHDLEIKSTGDDKQLVDSFVVNYMILAG